MRTLLAALVLLTSLIPLHAADAPRAVSGRPFIESVSGRTVRVRVPAGVAGVTLERLTSARNGRWEVVATKAANPAARTVDFVLSQPVSRRFLRVKGAATAPTVGALVGARLFLADPALSGGGVFSSSVLAQSGNLAGLSAVADHAATSTVALGRAVAESDIWRVDGDRLYFFNELRGLQVFDITDPDDPALLGQLRAAGAGEQMYLIGTNHVALLVRSSSYLQFPVVSFANVAAAADANVGAVVVVDVAQGNPVEVARVEYRGSLRESRRVGSVLYVVSEVWESSGSALEITSFDLSDPAHPVKRDRLAVNGWGGVIHATDRFLFVVRYSDDWEHSIVDVIDISSPTGALARRGSLETGGRVNDKFKMHLDGDIFTAVSDVQRRWIGNWWIEPVNDPATASRTRIETFSLVNPDAPVALGSLEVGLGETVRATRFDDKRVYVVTFFQIDPLWVIDLSQPATPTLLGELEVPGFSNYIEPLGDRLVAVGRVGNQTAVSLFDVSDPSHPRALSQLPLGDGATWSEANWDEKAFTVVPEENLIVVPYSGYQSATGYASRVQLIDLTRDALVKRGIVDHGLSARRTAVKGNRLLALSSSDLVTVDFADRDHPRVTSEVEIAWRVDRVLLAGNYLLQFGGSVDGAKGQSQTLSVSTASDPDSVLTTVTLDSARVIGATVRDGRLYVAQKNAKWPHYSTLVFDPSVPNQPVAPNPVIFSVFDLTALPAVPRLARTEHEVQIGYATELTAVWPSPAVLVWVRKASDFFAYIDRPIALPGPISGGILVPGGGLTIHATGAPFRDAIGGSAAITAPVQGINSLPQPPAAVSAASKTRSDVRASAASAVASSNIRAGSISGNASIIRTPATGFEALVFDVSTPAAPVLASSLNLRASTTGNWSEAFAAGGKLYVSAMAYEDFVTIGAPNSTSLNAPSRRFRHFMKVADLTDPVNPVVSGDINIPGRLIGISNLGTDVYTVGCRYQPDTTPTHDRALHVSSFDGTAVTFIDQVAIDSGAAYALDVDTVLVGVRDTATQQDKIQAWQMDARSKFVRLSETVTADASRLFVIRGLLVAGGAYGARNLYDVTDAVNVRALGSLTRSANLWWGSDLSKADGSPSRGFWEPLGNYGIDFLEFAP